MCLLALCRSLFEKCVFKSCAHFVILLALCYYWISVILYLEFCFLIRFASIFSHSVEYIFTPLLVSLDAKKKLISWSPVFLLFLCCLCLWCPTQETIASFTIMKLLPYIVFKSFTLLSLTFRAIIHFELIYVYVVR